MSALSAEDLARVEAGCREAIRRAAALGLQVLPFDQRDQMNGRHIGRVKACQGFEARAGDFSAVTGHQLPALEGGFDGELLEADESPEIHAIGQKLRAEVSGG
jgi:4-alpha-glucanotransferase